MVDAFLSDYLVYIRHYKAEKQSNNITTMIHAFFDINTVFFTLWDYPMSYLEFFGTILNILCVWLTTKKSIWNWPVGILAVILFGILFYQIQLYSDFIEQIYFLGTGIWGWFVWTKLSKERAEEGQKTGEVRRSSWSEVILTVLALVVGTALLGTFMGSIHVLLPSLFPEPATFPFLDAFTTVASFAAQVLLIFKRVENWYLWIVIDVIGVWLYYEKEVKFVAVLYFIFLVLATKGMLAWRKELAMHEKREALAAGEGVATI